MRIYNLFISHSWAYHDHHKRLNEFFERESYFQYKDYSVPKDDPIHTNGTDKDLESAIENKIQPSSIVVVMAGVYSSYSKWIKKEVRIAQRQGKPILAVAPWGNERVSQFVRDNADDIVGWNGSSIVSAIKRLCN